MCLYDTRITPVDVVTDVLRTHPYLATADGRHLANDCFEDPVTFLTQRPPAAADPLETSAPVAELVDPAPSAVRRVLREVCLDAARIGDFLIAVSEAVVNAQMHSRPPVRVRVWTAPDRLLVSVTDPGRGPGDPFIGLQPVDDASEGGFGLWIAHQLCSHVTMSRDVDGFTIRLVQCLDSGRMPVSR